MPATIRFVDGKVLTFDDDYEWIRKRVIDDPVTPFELRLEGTPTLVSPQHFIAVTPLVKTEVRLDVAG